MEKGNAFFKKGRGRLKLEYHGGESNWRCSQCTLHKQQQQLKIQCKPSHRVRNLEQRESSRIGTRHSSAMKKKMRVMWMTLMKLRIQWMKSGSCKRNAGGRHTVMIGLHV